MSKSNFTLKITPLQYRFMNAKEDEILFGGAAGGGKSFGQLADALQYALRYPGSRQLLLRRTLPELETSLIRTALTVYPSSLFRYVSSRHTGTFSNGSILDFGYCDSERDVIRYQSVEYDVIRFDELTHFTESMYLYLMSRLRGAAPYPRQMKSTTNPGGIGHDWVKRRFVDPAPSNTIIQDEFGTRRFIPAKVADNQFLTAGDPDYVKRLQRLPERERRALLEGDWDLCEGRFFTRWDRSIHVCDPFPIPEHWRVYFAMDYGLDMFAGLFIAEDEQGFFYVFRELYESGLIVSEAAKRICKVSPPRCPYYAPPDLWSRQKDTGKAIADLFREHGVPLTRVSAARAPGWALLQEWLMPRPDRDGNQRPKLQIFSTCTNLIRCLPSLEWDPAVPGDCRTEPHELTHAPDALRYFAMGHPGSVRRNPKKHAPDLLGGYRKELII
ncbi:MAG: phage terminase large subunit [Clostridia bacterium]|nr:phage terminase large subunit [Clostridia bacterium]